MPFIPHTKQDVALMLETIGEDSIEALFDEIPAHLRAKALNPAVIPEGKTEMEMARFLQGLAKKDEAGLCFIGAGAYEHHIPAAVWDIASRGEFLTSYTPYQAEASQGTLQLLYEYQTMMASLMGLDVSNASLYDGASALAEAILMSVRANRASREKRIILPTSLHPYYRKVVKAIVNQQGVQVEEIPYDKATGTTDLKALEAYAESDVTALVIPNPNFFGQLEPVDDLVDWAHAKGALAIAVVNPTATALLKEPGQWGQKGADLACGEGQPLGVPMASGGPYFGFLCCKQELVRQMPGRIVGQTVDLDGKIGFALTLQAREQHIRRSKATSNICTNQGLLVTAATVYMSLLGPEGLKHVALHCHANTERLLQKLSLIKGVKAAFKGHRFHEVVLQLDKPVVTVLELLAKAGIQGGFALNTDYPELGEALLLCVTETKTEADLDAYAKALTHALAEASGQGASCQMNDHSASCEITN